MKLHWKSSKYADSAHMHINLMHQIQLRFWTVLILQYLGAPLFLLCEVNRLLLNSGEVIRVQVSKPWPGALTALTIRQTGFYPFPSNYFTPQLPNKHPSCPSFPPLLHMKEANHRCDLPFFTSDPPDTTITTSIPAPQPLNAPPPQLGGCFSLSRWQMRGRRLSDPLASFSQCPPRDETRGCLCLGERQRKRLSVGSHSDIDKLLSANWAREWGCWGGLQMENKTCWMDWMGEYLKAETERSTMKGRYGCTCGGKWATVARMKKKN